MNPHRTLSTVASILSPGVALLLTSLPVAGQLAPQTPTASASEQPQEEIVRMSAFEVTTTQGHGYVTGNAAEALKTNQSLMDIPQIDVVVTNDLIKDTGYWNTADIVAYFGLSDYYEGEALAMRGARIAYPYVDDMPDNQTNADSAEIDTIEVVKGPAETLYLNSSISGIVLKSLKKPLPFDQDLLTASVN